MSTKTFNTKLTGHQAKALRRLVAEAITATFDAALPYDSRADLYDLRELLDVVVDAAKVDEAYQEGFAAYGYGRTIRECFLYGDERVAAWRKGWKAALRADEAARDAQAKADAAEVDAAIAADAQRDAAAAEDALFDLVPTT
jgi:hypothetical protein